MSNLVESIKMKLNTRYNGLLYCDEQCADLFVNIDGNEETIGSIDTEEIHFYGFDMKLDEADIHILAYINEVI